MMVLALLLSGADAFTTKKREKDDSRMKSTDTQTTVESCTERNCKVQQRVGDESFYVNLRTFHGAESI